MGLIQLDPPIRSSITTIADGVWALGSLMILERNPNNSHESLASWKSGDDVLCIRNRNDARDGPFLPPAEAYLDPEIRIIHALGARRAVWALGDTIIKVREWVSGMEMEGAVTQYVKNLGMPTPEVLYEWAEPSTIRSFLILRRVEGKTLEEKWPSLTQSQQENIAMQVAELIHRLACENKSPMLCTLSGNGVIDEWLMEKGPWPQIPGEKRFLGPYSPEELYLYIASARWKHNFLKTNETFHLFHADTGPTNIILSEDLKVTLIDWELAGFYPWSWIYIKTRVSAGYTLEGDNIINPVAWKRMLGAALSGKGITGDLDGYVRWREG